MMNFLQTLQLIILSIAVTMIHLVNGLSSTFVYGPQSRELLLLTAKIAAHEGIETSFVCASGTETGCRNLMYGSEYAAADQDEPGKARPISQPEDMQKALETTESLILIGHDNPIDEKTINTFLSLTGSNLSKVILLSKIGVTRAKGGFLGSGGDEVMLKECEQFLGQVCKNRNLSFSIVRAGLLKGGGPGQDFKYADLTLDRTYYNTILDIVESRTAEFHDKFTLGAECLKGDPLDIPNVISQISSKSSFEPAPGETNRVVAAAACVAASTYEDSIDVTISTAKSQDLPTMEDFQSMFSSLK